MSHSVRAVLLLTTFLSGCGKPAEPASPPTEYGYEFSNDPLDHIKEANAKPPASCAGVRCPSGKVCRVLPMADDLGDDAHAYCLGQDDDLCKLDPELCQNEICRTSPQLCQ